MKLARRACCVNVREQQQELVETLREYITRHLGNLGCSYIPREITDSMEHFLISYQLVDVLLATKLWRCEIFKQHLFKFNNPYNLYLILKLNLFLLTDRGSQQHNSFQMSFFSFPFFFVCVYCSTIISWLIEIKYMCVFLRHDIFKVTKLGVFSRLERCHLRNDLEFFPYIFGFYCKATILNFFKIKIQL